MFKQIKLSLSNVLHDLMNEIMTRRKSNQTDFFPVIKPIKDTFVRDKFVSITIRLIFYYVFFGKRIRKINGQVQLPLLSAISRF